jgi:hypothetical protein
LRRLTTSKALVSVTLTAGALLTGCASTDRELRRELIDERNEGLTIVSRAHIAAQPPGSPGRTAMLLWRAVQFRDAKGAVALLTPEPTGHTLASVEEYIAGGGAVIAQERMPEIIDVHRNGRRAVMDVDLQRTRKLANHATTETSGRLRLDFIRTGSGWKLRWREAIRQVPRMAS